MTYDPGSITVTTKYRRCTRRAGCTTWLNTNFVTKTVTTTCNNITSAGTIGSDESGVSPFNPSNITELTAPAGGSGTLEYKWQQCTDGATWQDIAGATAMTYDPGSITVTTKYRRCTRRAGCTTWLNTNFVTKTVTTSGGAVVIGDKVFNDANNNGIQDAGEAGVSSVAVNLYNAAGSWIGYTSTDANGNYSFSSATTSGLTAGGSYKICFNLPWPYTTASPKDQGTDDAIDSDVNAASGSVACTDFFVAPSGSNLTIDAGINDGTVPSTPTLSISDVTVTEGTDATASLQICSSTTSSSPITVTYTTSNGTAMSGSDYTTTTATATIPAGQTCVTVTVPIINDTNPESPETFNVTLSSPSGATINDGTGIVTILDNDATTCSNITSAGTIGSDESGVSPFNPSNITELTAPAGGSGTLEYKWQQCTDGATWQDIAGATAMTYDPGSITVTTKYRRCTRRAGCTTWLNTNFVTKTVTTSGGAVVIGDKVFNDANNNGIQDAGEAGVSSVAVNLYNAAGSWIGYTSTDANGNYSFSSATTSGLTAGGSYRICFNLPWPYTTASPKDQGTDDAIDSDVNAASNGSVCTDLIIVSSGTNLTIDAGISDGVSPNFCDDIQGGSIGYNQSICSGGDPAPIVSIAPATTSQPDGVRYQWFSYVGPTAPTTTIGDMVWNATGESYDPPAWQITQRTWFRRCSGVNNSACTTYPGETPWIMVDVTCSGKTDRSNADMLTELTVSPVPASDYLNVLFNASSEQGVSVRVLDLAGRLVSAQVVFATSGDNVVSFDVTNMVQGHYIVEVDNGTTREHAKFVVIH